MRLTLSLLLLAGSVAWADPAPAAQPPAAAVWSVRVIGTIADKDIKESSGIIASRRFPGVYWTHNDSGNGPHLFAINREGQTIGRFKLNVPNVDWEDIAIDDAGRLYIADIGNNALDRRAIVIHRFDEPNPQAAAGKARNIRVSRSWRLSHPNEPFDSEAFFVWKGHGYLISKLVTGAAAGLYRFPLDAEEDPIPLERVGSLPIRSPVTAADISADGRQLAVLSLFGLHLFQIDGDVDAAAKAKSWFFRLIHPNIEACCFVPDGVLVTSERRQIYLVGDHSEAGAE